jgi:hypothetical protein
MKSWLEILLISCFKCAHRTNPGHGVEALCRRFQHRRTWSEHRDLRIQDNDDTVNALTVSINLRRHYDVALVSLSVATLLTNIFRQGLS